MNTKTLAMDNKKSKSMFIKRWKRVDGNGKNDDDNSYSSAITYNTSQVGKKISFSIGDNWVERVGKKVYLYNVVGLEDIIIPAGAYKCYKVIEDMDGGIKNYYWFAPEIGLVKWEIGKIKGILKGWVKGNEV